METSLSLEVKEWLYGEFISFLDLFDEARQLLFKAKIHIGKGYFTSNSKAEIQALTNKIKEFVNHMYGGQFDKWRFHYNNSIQVELVIGTVLRSSDAELYMNMVRIPFEHIPRNIVSGFITFPNEIMARKMWLADLQFNLSLALFDKKSVHQLPKISTYEFTLKVKDPDENKTEFDAKVQIESSICDSNRNFRFAYIGTDRDDYICSVYPYNMQGIPYDSIDLETLVKYAKRYVLTEPSNHLECNEYKFWILRGPKWTYGRDFSFVDLCVNFYPYHFKAKLNKGEDYINSEIKGAILTEIRTLVEIMCKRKKHHMIRKSSNLSLEIELVAGEVIFEFNNSGSKIAFNCIPSGIIGDMQLPDTAETVAKDLENNLTLFKELQFQLLVKCPTPDHFPLELRDPNDKHKFLPIYVNAYCDQR